ncbi:AI-2E family transporter [Corynebacterium sanguinis]|uniref:AI-2E family transporter n=1 Tax=Corynebacterium sanguinis TaxID=2594913 RepID=A0A838WZR0_9CORY|nr:AI-2E family transporter [Corynebacterium sanguinis]MBA4503897.1 AI-2E family transporter [Corynebacterium sanguinis]MCT1414755.1 AI-2E family transporter [Corynebacterium sanguinis]MCT1498964.1 AI-2E family transporter [Corynebacterium sanguinis]MCT1882836.1 AI-2E family transporter [Corynebacterium sanguinis]MDN8622479.1 AI-2E family transporter [Corynebacterium sanguinis]
MRDGAPEPKVDDERRDIVDRGVVLNSWLKSAAMTVLRILIICVFLFALSQLIGTFWQGILPVILAIIVCTVLAPIAGFLRRRAHFPSALAALISLLIFFGLIGTLVFLIAPDIAAHSRVLYLQAFEGIQRLQLWLQGPPINMDPDDLNEAVNTVAQWLQNQAGTIAGGVFAGIGTAAGLIVTLTVVLVLTFFFLKDGPRFLPWLRATAGGRPGLHATELLTRAWNTLSGFIRAQAIVSLVDAFFIGVGIWLVGVPMAFTLSVITFIAGFIPIVGAVVAGALAVLIALVSLGFTEAIIVLLIVLAVQQLEGNVLSPVLQSKAMDLHPVIVLVSVTIGGGLFGLVGAFLAVPVAAMIAVVFRYMMDVMQIHSGEKKADQLIFSTPEGLAIAELEEQESLYERKEWRGDRDWATTPVPAEELVSPPKGSQSWKVLRSSGELLQLAKPSELRRRFAARDKGSNT